MGMKYLIRGSSSIRREWSRIRRLWGFFVLGEIAICQNKNPRLLRIGGFCVREKLCLSPAVFVRRDIGIDQSSQHSPYDRSDPKQPQLTQCPIAYK